MAAIDELAARSAEAGFTLRERLTIYPRVRPGAATPWLDPRLPAHVAALADPATGLAREDATAGRAARGRSRTAGSPQRPDRPARHIDTDGRTERPARRLRQRLRRLGRGALAQLAATAAGRAGAARLATCRAGLGWPRTDPAALLDPAHDEAALALFSADGPALDELARHRRRRAPRRAAATTSPTWSTATSTSPTSATSGCRFCAFAQRERDADAYRLSVEQVADRAEEAWRGRRDRGLHAGRHRPEAAGHRLRRPGPGGEGPGAGHARARVLADGDRHRRGQGRRVHRATGSPSCARPGWTPSRAPPPRSSTTRCAGC